MWKWQRSTKVAFTKLKALFLCPTNLACIHSKDFENSAVGGVHQYSVTVIKNWKNKSYRYYD